MPFYDISVPLSGNTPTYPGDPEIKIDRWLSIEKGDSANVSMLHFGAHSGTHVDAPAHFIAGAARVESLPLKVLIGEAEVIEVPSELDVIDEDFVARRITPNTERVLFKTRNSGFWQDKLTEFQFHYTHINRKAAEKLIELGIKLVGIDYLSIEKFQSETHETHLCLLAQGVVILEGLNLAGIAPGGYELICLPLKLAGGDGDGAPARAVLRQAE